jgi:hypothetical protein
MSRNTSGSPNLSEELIAKIVAYAGMILGELDIVHPSDGFDPLFNTFKPIKLDYVFRWQSALVTRAALCSVSRQFWRLATPILYSSFIISGNSSKKNRFYSTITFRPDLGNLVRRLTIVSKVQTKEFLRPFINLCPNLIILHSHNFLDDRYLPLNLRVLSIPTDRPFPKLLSKLFYDYNALRC